MKVFLDTSSLFKLYHREEGTAELEEIFTLKRITGIYLSDIAKIEFSSTIWKKVRLKEISQQEAQTTMKLFQTDFEKFSFIPVKNEIIEQASSLISKYGIQGLRTLDSIQLATAISLSKEASIFFTADNLLKSIFIAEGLPTELEY